MSEHEVKESPLLPRRTVLKAAAVGAVATGLGAFLAACGIKTSSPAASAGAGASAGASVAPSTAASIVPSAAEAIPFKIGFVSPQTGAVAGFGEPDPYIIGLVQEKLNAGFQAGGKNYAITIVQKDGKSDPATAAQVANDLITSDKVDMILATSTPENNNPVADAAEAAGVPFISTVEPWEAFFFARQKDPANPVPFKFTYHFCFGVAEFAKTYISMWDDIPTNKKVGVMWPNDADGNAIRAALGPQLTAAGYTIIDPGAYEDGTNDYSAADREVQGGGLPDLQHVPDPAGLRGLLEAGGAAGLRPEDRPDRQDWPVPVPDRGPRRTRPRPGERGILDPDVPVLVDAARNVVGRPRERLYREHRPSVEPGPRHDDRAVRRGDQRHRWRDRPEGQGRPRGRDRQAQHHLDDRQDRLHLRAVPERFAVADHRRPVDRRSDRASSRSTSRSSRTRRIRTSRSQESSPRTAPRPRRPI